MGNSVCCQERKQDNVTGIGMHPLQPENRNQFRRQAAESFTEQKKNQIIEHSNNLLNSYYELKALFRQLNEYEKLRAQSIKDSVKTDLKQVIKELKPRHVSGLSDNVFHHLQLIEGIKVLEQDLRDIQLGINDQSDKLCAKIDKINKVVLDFITQSEVDSNNWVQIINELESGVQEQEIDLQSPTKSQTLGSPSKLPPGSIEKDMKSGPKLHEIRGALPLSPQNKKSICKAFDDDANDTMFGCKDEQMTPGRRGGSGERPHRFSMPDQKLGSFKSSEHDADEDTLGAQSGSFRLSSQKTHKKIRQEAIELLQQAHTLSNNQEEFSACTSLSQKISGLQKMLNALKQQLDAAILSPHNLQNKSNNDPEFVVEHIKESPQKDEMDFSDVQSQRSMHSLGSFKSQMTGRMTVSNKKVNSVMMINYLEKKQERVFKEIERCAKLGNKMSKLCQWYLDKDKGFFVHVLSTECKEIYCQQSQIYKQYLNQIQEECQEPNEICLQKLEQIKKMYQAQVMNWRNLGNEIEVSQAEPYVEACQKINSSVSKLEQQLVTLKKEFQDSYMQSHELREHIGDADMIQVTDKIFQRLHLKDIQKRFEYVQKQYKLVLDRIEQEMENNEEQEEDSDEEPSRVLMFSEDELQQDHTNINLRIIQNKKILQEQKSEVEHLTNQLQTKIIKTCSNKMMMKTIELNILTSYVKDTSKIINKLTAFQDQIDAKHKELSTLMTKYEVSDLHCSQSEKNSNPYAFNELLLDSQRSRKHSSYSDQQSKKSCNSGSVSLKSSNLLAELVATDALAQNILFSRRESFEGGHLVDLTKIYTQYLSIYRDFYQQQKEMIERAEMQTQLLPDGKVERIQSKRYKQIKLSIQMIDQATINFQQLSIEELKNDKSDKMQTIRQQIMQFDLNQLLKEAYLRLNKLEKTKNIQLKELQSLKAYSIDKSDRAQHQQEDQQKIAQILARLQKHVDHINQQLSSQVKDHLTFRLSNISWIGIDNDFKDGFFDLQDALQQLNNIQMNTDVVDHQFRVIQDSISLSQDIVTKIKINPLKEIIDEETEQLRQKPFVMVEYIKTQFLALSQEEDVKKRLSDDWKDFDLEKKISQIKKLSIHDYIVQGKRFQIKQPPVLTITDKTQLGEIIVKVGMSTQNLREFLLSILNETINQHLSAKNACGSSMSGVSGGFGPASSIMSGGLSVYAQGLKLRKLNNTTASVGGASVLNLNSSIKTLGSIKDAKASELQSPRNSGLKLGSLASLQGQKLSLSQNLKLKLPAGSEPQSQGRLGSQISPEKRLKLFDSKTPEVIQECLVSGRKSGRSSASDNKDSLVNRFSLKQQEIQQRSKKFNESCNSFSENLLANQEARQGKASAALSPRSRGSRRSKFSNKSGGVAGLFSTVNRLNLMPKPQSNTSGLKVNVQELSSLQDKKNLMQVKKPLVDITKEIQKVDLQAKSLQIADESKKDALVNQHNMQIINDKIKMKVLTGALKSIGGAGPPSASSKSAGNSEQGSQPSGGGSSQNNSKLKFNLEKLSSFGKQKITTAGMSKETPQTNAFGLNLKLTSPRNQNLKLNFSRGIQKKQE